MSYLRAARWGILVVGTTTSLFGERARAESKLDATYVISFARIHVGDITATAVVGNREYSISARGRAGGVIKKLMDGDGEFAVQGLIRGGHPTPTNFISKIVSNSEASGVKMDLEDAVVKELAVTPPPGS